MRGMLLLLALYCGAGIAAVGDLTVSPTRVIFEGRERSSQISLINRGSEAATYRIEFTQYRMDEHGQLQDIEQPNALEKFADRLVRFSPRQITLAPNQAQTVRLLLRKPKDLPAGEYRSHLMFYALPPENVGTDIETRNQEQDGSFSIAITPVFRVSIPVIVRHGELHATFNISDVQLKEEDQPTLSMRVDRSGNRSVYGDLGVQYMHPQLPEPIMLSLYKDFVLYTSHNTRFLDLELHVPEGVTLDSGGKIRVHYQSGEAESLTDLADYTLTIP